MPMGYLLEVYEVGIQYHNWSKLLISAIDVAYSYILIEIYL